MRDRETKTERNACIGKTTDAVQARYEPQPGLIPG